jgi:hypothetical protein
LNITVIVGGQIATAVDAGNSPAISYQLPVLSSISSSWYFTNGSNSITIWGSQFGNVAGAAAAVTLGSFTAQNCRVQLPHTTLVCDVGEGYGVNMLWRATICGQTSADSAFTTSFIAPIILSISSTADWQHLSTVCSVATVFLDSLSYVVVYYYAGWRPVGHTQWQKFWQNIRHASFERHLRLRSDQSN